MSDGDETVASVERFFRSFVAAYETADFEAITGNVTEDVRLDSGTSPTVSGKPAFRELVTQILSSFEVTMFRVDIQDVVPLDGHAFTVAAYTWTLIQKETRAADQQAGRFGMLLQWHEKDRRWRIRREVSF